MIHSWRIDAGALVTRQLDQPALTGDQVLVQVQAVVIGAAERRALTDASATVPGGSAVGVVVATAEAATQLMGKRVLVGAVMPCGECDACRRGGAPACPRAELLGETAHGAVASHVVANGRWVLPLVDGLALDDPRAAVLGREAAVAYAAYARTGVSPGEPVVITGDNIVTAFTAQVALAKGAEVFIASERASTWAEWFGTDVHIAPPALISDAIDAAGHAGKPRRIFETSSAADSRRVAVELATPASTIALLSHRAAGARLDPTPIPAEVWISRHATLVGIAGAHPDFAAEVVALAVQERLNLAATTRLIGASELPSLPAPELGPVPVLTLT